MVWGATCVRMAVACAHARPMVARLWKKYAARRKVNALSVGSSPKSSKTLTAWRIFVLETREAKLKGGGGSRIILRSKPS